ncbi:MAG: hypothetical protein JWQ59_931 [Cryobacterium sp.]|nr:hypothetical protein [Cryobacterium sp.]
MLDERRALSQFPPPVAVPAARVGDLVRISGRVLVVLDDDPTGTQSVSELPVLTSWEVADFLWAFGQGSRAVYVLTNTRSLGPAEAFGRNEEVVRNAIAASDRSGVLIGFVSRSDSTLRGHYPLETDTIARVLEECGRPPIDGVVIVPAFPEAGRVTLGAVHYVRDAQGLKPVSETEFARDSTFGFTNADLPKYVEEKTGGRVPASAVIVLDLTTIREGATAIADAIDEATRSTAIVADAMSEDDLRLLALGLEEAESRGKQLLYRVGPPFVRARIGQEPRSPLLRDEIFRSGQATAQGGLIVVGSHVGLTTRQLAHLRETHPNIPLVEIDVETLIGTEHEGLYLQGITHQVLAALVSGDVILQTSRALVRSNDPDASLAISREVSAAIVAVVRRVIAAAPPRFVVAKGGITSSDVATFGLGIRHAIVRGPMLPGLISLWEPVDGPAQGIPYVVFAGNVGADDSLSEVIRVLTATEAPPD